MRIITVVLFAILFQSFLHAQKVYVNQAGYIPNFKKLVYASEPADSFFVIARNTKEIKYRGPLSLIRSGRCLNRPCGLPGRFFGSEHSRFILYPYRG